MPTNLKPETAYEKRIRIVQDTFWRKRIHEDLSIAQLVRDSGLTRKTITNYFGRNKSGYQTRNPKTGTTFALADALQIDIQFVDRETGEVLDTTTRRRRR